MPPPLPPHCGRRPLPLLLLLLSPLLVRGDGGQENVRACLVPAQDQGVCNKSRTCDGVSFGEDRSCLSTSVPWDTPYLQVRCCFRCCLYYWQRRLGLDKVFQFRRSNKLHDPRFKDMNFGREAFLPLQDEILLHRWTVALFSTVLGEGQNGTLSWFPRHGTASGPMAITGAQTSSAKPASYVHLGDDWNGGMQAVVRPNPGSLKDYYFLTPNYYNNLEKMPYLHAMPIGINLPSATFKKAGFLSGSEVHRSDESRPTLLGCGCCFALGRSMVPGSSLHGRQIFVPPEQEKGYLHREFVLKELRRNGFPCNCTDVWLKHEGNTWNPRLSLQKRAWKRGQAGYWCPPRDYGDLLATAKFTISPYGHGWQNFREWEVLALGGVPLVDWHPVTEGLWRDLPVVQVRNWTLVTPQFLEGEWTRLQQQRDSLDLKKAFWPYWFGELHKNMEAAPVFVDLVES